MLDFFDPNAGGSQTVTHRLRGKPRTMLHSIKPLFFNRGDQFAVVDDCSRCVTVICVYAKNVQVKNCELGMSNFGFEGIISRGLVQESNASFRKRTCPPTRVGHKCPL